jgi:hypothetical protein
MWRFDLGCAMCGGDDGEQGPGDDSKGYFWPLQLCRYEHLGSDG